MQDKRVLYERSVAQYGVKKSVQKCIEEMAELIIELSRYDSGRLNMDKIAEETAHVLITIDKLIYYWGMLKQVEEEQDKVLEHLRLLLENNEQEEKRWRGLYAKKVKESTKEISQEKNLYKAKFKSEADMD